MIATSALISSGFQGVSAISSMFGSSKAKKAAEEAAARNAHLVQVQTAESIRRAEAAFDQQYGMAVAGTGGSGARGDSGSPALYLEAMQTESNRQLDWMQYAGDLKASNILQGGKDIGDSAMLGGFSDLLGRAGSWADSSAGKEIIGKLAGGGA